jgi:ABC-2 type transport system permease protein
VSASAPPASASAGPVGASPRHASSPSLDLQVRALARRSIRRTLRQPVLVVPNVVFPLFMLAVLSSAGKEVTKVKGFPTHSYITFIISATLIQGAAGAVTVAGNALGNDIETGFLSRIALTPVKVPALVISQLAGVAVLGFGESVVYLLVGLAGGAHVAAGFGGALAVLALVLLTILAFGSIGLLAAVLTGSAQQAQGVFVIGLGLLFMSSMMMPRNLITASWFKEVATYNPMSYLVEAPRSLFITGWNAQALELGAGIAAGALIFFLAAAIASLRTRILA